jgi:hypothetical protein
MPDFIKSGKLVNSFCHYVQLYFLYLHGRSNNWIVFVES